MIQNVLFAQQSKWSLQCLLCYHGTSSHVTSTALTIPISFLNETLASGGCFLLSNNMTTTAAKTAATTPITPNKIVAVGVVLSEPMESI